MVPDKILYEFDGPKIFTTKDTEGKTHIAYLCHEDADSRFFLISMPQLDMQTTVELLEDNKLEVRVALTRYPFATLIEVNNDDVPIKAGYVWAEDCSLPAPGVYLRDKTLPQQS